MSPVNVFFFPPDKVLYERLIILPGGLTECVCLFECGETSTMWRLRLNRGLSNHKKYIYRNLAVMFGIVTGTYSTGFSAYNIELNEYLYRH